MPEYEALKAGGGVTLALTLLRCVGWLSRGDMFTRKGYTGPFIATPDAQCAGEHEFIYSVVTHKGSWLDAKAWKHAYSRNVPLLGINTAQSEGTLPASMSFISVSPDNIIISALKKAEKDNSIIIRIFNTTAHETTAEIKVYERITGAYILNLNEERAGSVETVSDRSVAVKLGPFKIATLGIEFA